MRTTKDDLKEMGLIHGAAIGVVFLFFLVAAVPQFLGFGL